jgi:methylmalonyl-CoA mutase
MTINGARAHDLAMYMNTAIDQRVEHFLREAGRWPAVEAALKARRAGTDSWPSIAVTYRRSTTAPASGLLGASGRQLVGMGVLTDGEYAKLRAEALARVRGTVQADILKEDQAQNTCIFSTEFALRMMGDVQQFFSENDVRNFYSVSISGYHIAEAGANPSLSSPSRSPTASPSSSTTSARGMKIDDFAPNLSFFFSNGMDAEYAVIGRVARRIWARAMRDVYQAGLRSQMLKYHIQTSGRSLHAREIQFNDIRTTLQAMYALFDNCNSLHTNAYDER